jgi:predicted TIM-barrel fold metal-dependent hydrolase
MPRYFDALVHVTPDGRWFNTAHDASETRLLGEMDAAGVEKAVVVALAGHIDNAFVRSVCQRHPDRLLAGVSIDPSASATPEAAADALDHLLEEGPPAALKLHPRLHRYDLLDPRVLAALERLAGRQAPPVIWLDSLIYPPGVLVRQPLVESVRHVVQRFPGLRFVLLHAGGSRALEFYDAVAGLPNAVLDLSYSLTRYAGSSVSLDHRFLVERFDRRTVFGSDFPEVGPVEAVRAFERLVEGLADERVGNVAGATLERFLGLDGTPS